MDFDAVVHLAALSNDPLGNLTSGLTYDINHKASVRLAELAKAAGVKRLSSRLLAVHMAQAATHSAMRVRLSIPSHLMVSLNFVEPMSPHWQTTFHVQLTCGTLLHTEVSPRLRLDIVLNDLVHRHLNRRVLIKSDGNTMAAHRAHSDIIAAMVAALEAPREIVHNQTFNVGRTEENYSHQRTPAMVAEIVPECKVEYAPDGARQTLLPRELRQNPPCAARVPTEMDSSQRRAELYDAYRFRRIDGGRLAARSLPAHQPNSTPAKSRAARCFSALDAATRRSGGCLNSIPQKD